MIPIDCIDHLNWLPHWRN